MNCKLLNCMRDRFEGIVPVTAQNIIFVSDWIVSSLSLYLKSLQYWLYLRPSEFTSLVTYIYGCLLWQKLIKLQNICSLNWRVIQSFKLSSLKINQEKAGQRRFALINRLKVWQSNDEQDMIQHFLFVSLAFSPINKFRCW